MQDITSFLLRRQVSLTMHHSLCIRIIDLAAEEKEMVKAMREAARREHVIHSLGFLALPLKRT